jgi:hypothetical protein
MLSCSEKPQTSSKPEVAMENDYDAINRLTNLLDKQFNDSLLFLRAGHYMSVELYEKALNDLNKIDPKNSKALITWNKARYYSIKICWECGRLYSDFPTAIAGDSNISKALYMYNISIALDSFLGSSRFYERGLLYERQAEKLAPYISSEIFSNSYEDEYGKCHTILKQAVKNYHYKALYDFELCCKKDSSNMDCLFQIAKINCQITPIRVFLFYKTC